MKKAIITIIFFITVICVIAQNSIIIKGRLLDKKTGEPLPFGNVFYPAKSLGTISDTDGFFTFTITNAEETDSIIISYIGYKSLRTTISDCLAGDVFHLKPLVNKIATVDVKAKKFKLKTFMRETISQYNKNRKKEPHIAIAHYREKAKLKQEYIMYMESLGFSIYSGKLFNAARFSNYKFFCKDSKCAVENPLWINSKNQNEKPFPAGSSNLNVFRFFEMDGILTSKNMKKYSFRIDSTYSVNNNNIIRVRFNGNGDNGTIDIFAASKNIKRIDCSTKKYWSTIYHKRVLAKVSVQFNYFGNTPYISFIDSYYKRGEWKHFNTLTILVQKFSEFVLTQDEYWSIDRYSINPYIVYHSNIWENFSIPDDKNYTIIETDLKTDTLSLEERFVNFSGRWFFPNKIKSELARETIAGLKSNF